MTNLEIEQLKEEYNSKQNNIEVPFFKILEQIGTFKKGIPFLKLIRPCTIGDGIQLIDEEEEYDELISGFNEAAEEGRITKFVPASGAASRMFKSLLAVQSKFPKVKRTDLERCIFNKDEDCLAVLEFVNNIKRFAFYPALKKAMANDGYDFDVLLNESDYTEIIRYTLESDGLNYANQPKGSIIFHSYPDGVRTAFEEHLLEAANYAKSDGTSKVHFTISPEFRGLINSILKPAIKNYKRSGIDLEVSYSYQKPSTDTVAVNGDNRPFRDYENKLVFRPAGHGALLENLNDLKGDIIFIKNIDNIVTEHLQNTTYLYKKLLGGYLIKLQNKISTYLRALEMEDISSSTLNSIKKFAMNELSIHFDKKFDSHNIAMRVNTLKEVFNKPVRVCGMVKNEGEPGGGPFWVEDADGNISLQIVEKSQIDLNDEEQLKILEASTHFNPVDLVCGVRDYKGNSFNLLEYTNPDSGLITTKSKDGRELKALELPGLWNGSMAKWITVFVKVPAITFNPVKVVNDLLRKEHQPPETI
jgi:hypothetical protein